MDPTSTWTSSCEDELRNEIEINFSYDYLELCCTCAVAVEDDREHIEVESHVARSRRGFNSDSSRGRCCPASNITAGGGRRKQQPKDCPESENSSKGCSFLELVIEVY